MVRFSAKPKNEPPLLPFARAKRAQKGLKPWLFCQKTLNLGYAHPLSNISEHNKLILDSKSR
ncbi:MAG: hypothetical protein U5L45_02075 [Saprospiraceae bacterium]|nr:hypothetical protein [Saprospiraceae bacterium]